MANSVIRLVLGIPIQFKCESEQICHLVCKVYPTCLFEKLDSGFQVSISHSQKDSIELSRPAIFEVDHHCFSGRSGYNYFTANRLTGQASAVLCQRMLNDEYMLRHQVLNALCFYLLSYRNYMPVHAACFQLNQHLVLCLGKSGLGKSTLAMAAMQRNLPVISEDLCFVSPNPEIGIKADCREFHLYPDSYHRFCKEMEHPPSMTHNGKQKYIIKNIMNNNLATPEATNHSVLVLFLEQQHHQKYTQLEPVFGQTHFNRLHKPQEAGFDLISEARRPAIDWLQNKPCYQGSIGYCFDSFFERVVELGEQTACISL